MGVWTTKGSISPPFTIGIIFQHEIGNNSNIGEYQLVKQEMNDNDIEKIMNHWRETSNYDFKTMNELFTSRSYSWALFVGHISVEKLLKALYVKLHGKHAPTIHNLYRLAELCKIDLTDEFSDWLDTITSFNINARYDDYKREFYNLCTREYTESWIVRIKELRKWIEQML